MQNTSSRELVKKNIYELEEDPISYAKFGAHGVIRVREIDARGKAHYFYFTPETFKKIETHFYNVNPLTRNPITYFEKLSPPETEKIAYDKAAKVIQKHTRTFLAKTRGNNLTYVTPIPRIYRDYDIKEKKVVMYKGKVFRLKFRENWKPTYPPSIIEVKTVNWDIYNDLQKMNKHYGDKYAAYITCQYLNEHKDSVAPGDIIDLDYEHKGDYVMYITTKGTVQYVPNEKYRRGKYITPQMMKPFYDIRETRRDIYLKAIKMYTDFLYEYGNSRTHRVVHKYHRNTGWEYYNLDGTISTETIENPFVFESSVRSPTASTGGKKTKKVK